MAKTIFKSFVKKRFHEGQNHFASNLKAMVQYQDEQLFDLLDINNNNIFLDPLLFAYLNSEGTKVKLTQILYGYIDPYKRPEKIEITPNSEGVFCLPNIGYFETKVKSNEKLHLVKNINKNTYDLYRNNSLVNYVLKQNPAIYNTKIEIQQFSNPIIESYFRDRNNNIIAVDLKGNNSQFINLLNKATSILKTHYSEFYDCFQLATKWIMPFESAAANSFATLSVHGVGFLNMNENDDEVYCIEDIVHQCGHVILNSIMYNMREYFQIDPETPLKLFNSKEHEHRTIYVAFHGVFTEGLMNEAFDICLDNKIFSGRQEHEVKGRLTYILIRFLLDMESLNHEGIFTEKGLVIYKELQNRMIYMYNKYSKFIKEFNISNQPYNFDYSKFIMENPL